MKKTGVLESPALSLFPSGPRAIGSGRLTDIVREPFWDGGPPLALSSELEDSSDMPWNEPAFSRTEVNWAGDLLAARIWSEKAPPLEEAIPLIEKATGIVGNWRSSHSFPLNTIQVNLRALARPIFADVIVAQRLKRFPSILKKLLRQPTMELARMQDIGGCRAIVKTVGQVRRLHEAHLLSKARHVKTRADDYVTTPKASGYRGIHLVYRYQGRNEVYNKHLIEIQLRTQLQHIWATAVETVGTFLSQALKASEGSAPWLEFFKWVSSAFALSEGAPVVPGTSTDRRHLVRAVTDHAVKLDVQNKLQSYGIALHSTSKAEPDAAYFLLQLEPSKPLMKITGYRREDLRKAQDKYSAIEAKQKQEAKPGSQVVLVAGVSLANLRKSYPNYYLDTDSFQAELARIIR
jgi:hypothetical protein